MRYRAPEPSVAGTPVDGSGALGAEPAREDRLDRGGGRGVAPLVQPDAEIEGGDPIVPVPFDMVNHTTLERQSSFGAQALERELDPLADLQPLADGQADSRAAHLPRHRLEEPSVLRLAHGHPHPDPRQRMATGLPAFHVLPDDPILTGGLRAIERGVRLAEKVAEL